MSLSTEAILTGIYASEQWEPTPMRIAICRIRDGIPLGEELRAHPDMPRSAPT